MQVEDHLFCSRLPHVHKALSAAFSSLAKHLNGVLGFKCEKKLHRPKFNSRNYSAQSSSRFNLKTPCSSPLLQRSCRHKNSIPFRSTCKRIQNFRVDSVLRIKLSAKPFFSLQLHPDMGFSVKRSLSIELKAKSVVRQMLFPDAFKSSFPPIAPLLCLCTQNGKEISAKNCIGGTVLSLETQHKRN